jgi:hypothetical protein
MTGRDFLAAARQALALGTEAGWRTCAGRSYYALFLEARDALGRWGFRPTARDTVHTFVKVRFLYAADADHKADYDLTAPVFANDSRATAALARATNAVALLDGVEADPARRAAAITDIRARWP